MRGASEQEMRMWEGFVEECEVLSAQREAFLWEAVRGDESELWCSCLREELSHRGGRLWGVQGTLR